MFYKIVSFLILFASIRVDAETSVPVQSSIEISGVPVEQQQQQQQQQHQLQQNLDDLEQVIWNPCDEDLKTSAVSENIKVFVPQCPPVNGTESKCRMVKGHDSELIIQFSKLKLNHIFLLSVNVSIDLILFYHHKAPKEDVPDIERVIVARVPLTGRLVEMPYGPSISPCANSSTIASDGSECINDGVVANKNYTYRSIFKVLKSFPQVEGITTRVIVRQKLPEHKKIRLYKKHPGPVLACILIPNVEVTEDVVGEQATTTSTTPSSES
ncbi:leucine--tRNA ligase cytoplasmic-like [Sarcoptes scabiei]|nr:leucine--tRNA ligase cytoplasmic-like [Sarcoptes scabiei]